MTSFFIDPNIAKAKTIHTDFYTSSKYFVDAKEKIFAPSWQFIGDTGLVNENGSAYPFTLLEQYLDEPLLLVKDKEGALHCMSNVCTHRGNLVVYEACKLNQLRCKYHGRLFSLDGKFISMPEFKEVEDFPGQADNLHNLSLFQWGSLLFTSLQPVAPAAIFFKEMVDRVGWLPMDRLVYRADLSKDYHVKANWALYCENYLEGFHIPFVHAGLNAVLDFGEYTTEVFRYCNLQLGIGKKGDVCFNLPVDSPDYGKDVAAYYFWTFPNMMFNFYPWGLSLNIVQPLGINETKVSFLTYVFDESKLNTGAGSGLDTVELEDEEVVENVQKGIRSRFYTHGRYSPNREQGTHHFHSLIATFIQ
ncbi:aromatic ring-hydroxylating dioxygenase subunit alpha [Panacibacter sp. DH6]|uniref:Aromatic ring-hydroxylating dioxygenase subunit alpha n=1 Tax=Panacibacter microcysteis TaxID=2793269 RepID=A0A931E6S3_9BACT|nr:aromatic ring-hydroxylating dioxygenase subunit alpha [Panacibacter microcysteis]MBG9375354.1 aromatic ring-hydroxylating dioxygenase subunit alpha [Panacibacter microcysteis]